MRHMEALDWVRRTKDRAGEATAWEVNPAVHDGRFKEIAAAERTRRADVQEKIKQGAENRRAEM